MKRTNVYLDESQSRVLRHLAIEENRSFTDLVREALTEYLVRRGVDVTASVTGPRESVPSDDWEKRFLGVLQRIRSGVPTNMTSAEIEAEITEARNEVRASRRRRRPLAGG